jgi:hypothetical protein
MPFDDSEVLEKSSKYFRSCTDFLSLPGGQKSADPLAIVTLRKFHLAHKVLWPVLEAKSNLHKPCTYSSILLLDRQVRDFDLSGVSGDEGSDSSVSQALQSWLLRSTKEQGGP